MKITIRRAGLADYETLMELVNRVFFKSDPTKFQTILPNLYLSPEAATEHAYLAFADGKLIGHVGVYPTTLACGAVTLTAGGIGGVATDPDFRSHGAMSRMLEASILGMEQAGFDISVLWGDRGRYGHFGWELAGVHAEWRFDDWAAGKAGVVPAPLAGFSPRLHVADVVRLWNADPVGTRHTPESLVPAIMRNQLRTVVTTGGVRAFALYQVNGDMVRVDKLAGDSAALPGILMALKKTLAPTGRVLVRSPIGAHPLNDLALRFGTDPSQRLVGNIRIINHARVIAKLKSAQLVPATFSEKDAQALGLCAWARAVFGTPLGEPLPKVLAGASLPLPMLIEESCHV